MPLCRAMYATLHLCRACFLSWLSAVLHLWQLWTETGGSEADLYRRLSMKMKLVFAAGVLGCVGIVALWVWWVADTVAGYFKIVWPGWYF